MTQIDTVGTYIGEIVESAISTTKNGFPQWTPRLKAIKKYIETKEELEHYQLSEPAYIDYSQFEEDTVAFLVLYGGKDGSDPAPTLNYDQAVLAVGWDGQDFETLNASVGKKILFRVESRTYQDKTSLQVNWIDKEDASPTKTLKALDPSGIKDLNAKFLKNAKKPVAKPVTAAKPATTKPGKPGATGGTTSAPSATAGAAPSAAPKVAAPTAPAPETTATPTTTSPSKPPKAPKPPKAATTEAPPAEAAALPTSTTQLDGWNYVNENKGSNEDKVIEDAWLAACKEIGGDNDQDTFTGEQWAAIRDVVIRDLSL